MNRLIPPPTIAVIINAHSGSAGESAQLPSIRDRFSAHGLHPLIHLCYGGEDLRNRAAEAVAAGCQIVVAGGGDGTVSTVASAVVGTGAALGVLPLGTLNHFSKDSGIPLDLDQAVAAIAAGHRVAVDVGEVNGRIFINNSSLGLYPMIVHHRETHLQLGRSKWWALLRGMLTVIGWYPTLQVSLSLQQGVMVRRTPLVFIGNNEYELHGLSIGTRARMDAGELSVYVAHHVGRSGLLRLALRALWGRLRGSAELDTLSTREVEVSSPSRQLRVALDGELVHMAPPLRYRCLQKKLQVVVPKPEEKG